MAVWMWAKCGLFVASEFPLFSLCAHVCMYGKKSITEALLQRGELLKNDSTYLSRKCSYFIAASSVRRPRVVQQRCSARPPINCC